MNKATMAFCMMGLFLVEAPVSAATITTVTLDDYVLLPNTADQKIEIFVNSGAEVQGLELFLQVADGGPTAGGLIVGPTITDVDILTNTIFAFNNTGLPDGLLSLPQFFQRGTTTSSGTVTTEGLLATVTFNTAGFFATGPVTTWELRMAGTVMGDSIFPGTPLTPMVITNGSISIVPEPGTVVSLFALGIMGASIGGWRRWRNS